MKREFIRTIEIQNRHINDFEKADLFRGVTEETLYSTDVDWRPMFESALPRHIPEDLGWDWWRKADLALGKPWLYEMYSVEKDGKTQGLMMISKGGVDCFSRHSDHPQAPLIYIEYLATAPWNRPEMTQEHLYKGVGRWLFLEAVTFSVEQESDGRIGLHSLPRAEPFYRDRMNMTDFGNEPPRIHQGLRYFELSTKQAAVLIAEAASTTTGVD